MRSGLDAGDQKQQKVAWALADLPDIREGQETTLLAAFDDLDDLEDVMKAWMDQETEGLLVEERLVCEEDLCEVLMIQMRISGRTVCYLYSNSGHGLPAIRNPRSS